MIPYTPHTKIQAATTKAKWDVRSSITQLQRQPQEFIQDQHEASGDLDADGRLDLAEVLVRRALQQPVGARQEDGQPGACQQTAALEAAAGTNRGVQHH